MKVYFTLLLLLFGVLPITFSQTKLISFKSHSGDRANFESALHKNLFDMGYSNFGVAPMRMVKYARLDSLVQLTDSTVVMITSNICKNLNGPDSSLWSAGKDTLLHHPLFNLAHSEDSIKSELDEKYNFVNEADSVVFIGFEPKELESVIPKKEQKKHKRLKQKKAKREKAKGKPKQQLQAFSFRKQFFAIIGLGVLALCFGFVSAQWRK